MKPGDLVRVKLGVWKLGNVAQFQGEIGIVLRIELTPPYLGGDEMCDVLIGNSVHSFYPDELELVSEAG